MRVNSVHYQPVPAWLVDINPGSGLQCAKSLKRSGTFLIIMDTESASSSLTHCHMDLNMWPKHYRTLGIISTPRLLGPLKYKYPFESLLKKFCTHLIISTPRVQVPINDKAASTPAKSSVALYNRQGWPENTNGFEIAFLTMIFMHSISNPLPFSKGEVYKRDGLPSCMQSRKLKCNFR